MAAAAAAIPGMLGMGGAAAGGSAISALPALAGGAGATGAAGLGAGAAGFSPSAMQLGGAMSNALPVYTPEGNIPNTSNDPNEVGIDPEAQAAYDAERKQDPYYQAGMSMGMDGMGAQAPGVEDPIAKLLAMKGLSDNGPIGGGGQFNSRTGLGQNLFGGRR